ncbi:MAG TPA: dihydrofolate reductase family protein [Thermoplasmata archaeon]|nr:dihydrofolate reductase family protein [Thermoplasmata archaeon]
MRSVALHMYVTLDGRSEFPEYPGSGDPPNQDADPVATEMWLSHLDAIDTILLGRHAYEQWAEFWPRSKRTPGEHPFYHEFSRFLDRVQKVVFSKSLTSADWERTEIARGELASEIRRLKRAPGKEIAVGGGATLAQELMKRGLIDEYFLTIFPVVLGRGRNLFAPLPSQQTLELLSAKSFRHGEVVLHYRTVRG